MFKEDFVKVDENYDPTEFFTGLGGGMVGEQHVNGAGTGNGQVRSEISDNLELRTISVTNFFFRVTICKMTWLSVMTVKMRRQMVMMILWHSEEKKYLFEHIILVKYRTQYLSIIGSCMYKYCIN